MDLTGESDTALVTQAFEAIEKLLARLSSGGGTVRPTRLKSAYGRAATDDVLAAANVDDLRERIDGLVVDEEFWSVECSTATVPPADTSSFENARIDIASLTAVLGSTAAERCRAGHEAYITVARAVRTFATNLHKSSAKVELPAGGSKSYPHVADFIYDVSVPALLRDAVLAFVGGAMAAIVIARAEERGEKLPPWLALELADAFAQPPLHGLATIASEDSLGLLVDSVADAKALGSAIERWRDRAILSARPIYFPFDADDAETR